VKKDKENYVEGNWRKPARSNSQGACVEVGSYRDGARVGVRDTKDPQRAVTLEFPAGAWQAFLGGLR